MSSIKRWLGVALFAILCLALQDNTAKAAGKWNRNDVVTVKKDGCEFLAYLSGDGRESWIYRVKINGDGLEKLVFPKKVKGAPVTRLACGDELYSEDDDWYFDIFGNVLEPWHGCYSTIPEAKDITAIEFPPTVTKIEAGAFCGLESLKKLEIPQGVTELNSYSFAACKSLKKVKLPKSLKTFATLAFDKSGNISSISISDKSGFSVKNGFLIKDKGKKAMWVAPAQKKAKIPAGVKIVDDFSFLTSKAREVTIPGSVREIGLNAFSSPNIDKVHLNKGNKAYAMDSGCIYHKKSRQLTAVLVGKNYKVKISSKVKILGEGTSVMGCAPSAIKRVDIPKSVKKVIEDWMFFDDSAKVYFHGKTPPKVESRYPGQVYTALPIFNPIYVPKGCKQTYIQWAADRDGLEWDKISTF